MELNRELINKNIGRKWADNPTSLHRYFVVKHFALNG
jgi:hypothetical protein